MLAFELGDLFSVKPRSLPNHYRDVLREKTSSRQTSLDSKCVGSSFIISLGEGANLITSKMVRSLKKDTVSGFPKSPVRAIHKPKWSVTLAV